MDLGSKFSQHPLVPTCYRVTGTPQPLLWILQPRGWGCHSPRGSSQYNADILVTCSFLYLDLLSAIFGSTPPLSIWFRVMTTLDSPRCPCFWLCFPYIYNKLSPPPYLGTFESFSFLFISFFFFHSWAIEDLVQNTKNHQTAKNAYYDFILKNKWC